MAEVVFATVIYKNSEEYFSELLESIKRQTEKCFKLLLINDNYDEEVFDKKCQEAREYCQVEVLTKSYSGKGLTPQELRIELLKTALELKVDLLISGDSDDTFAESRVENILKGYEKNPNMAFYYNDLCLPSGEKIFTSLPERMEDIGLELDANFLGMSTTAINMKFIDRQWVESLEEGLTPVFDWYIYTRMLLDNKPGIYIPKATTFYRIYEGNEVGINKSDIKDLNRERDVKLIHYKNLLKRYENLGLESKIKQLEELEINEEFIKSSFYNKDNKGFWWNHIRLEDNYEI